jgi:FkbM family methyltransferase
VIPYFWKNVETNLIDFTIYDASFKLTEEGTASYVFHPDRPEATDRGPTGMVAEMAAFARLTRGRKRLLDVGALFGFFSLVFTSRPGTSAVAIEPSPWAWPILWEHIEANLGHRIEAIQMFAGDKQRLIEVGRDWKHVVAGIVSLETATVTERQIDDITGDFDTMKIDVEGYEVQVLRGARKLIERCKPLIFLEVHSASLPSVGESVESLLAVIGEIGYCVRDYDGKPVTYIDPGSMTRVLCEPT